MAFPRLRPSRGRARTGHVLGSDGAIAFGFWKCCLAIIINTRPLVCHFVSVGHGVAVLAELPDGNNLLYDSGRLGSPLTGVRPVSSVLWSRGITHLDAIVISHADADHFNAIPGLIDRFSVGAVYVSPVMFDHLPPAVKELRDAIERRHVPLREIHSRAEPRCRQ